MKILIVEDESISGLLLSRSLTKMGHMVDHAMNGMVAWSLYEKQNYQCVISDWMMPEMDGLDLCRKIRKQSGVNYTYIILLTSRSRKEDYLEGMNAGADDFLTKPLDPDQLFARLRVAERIVNLKDHVTKLEGLLPICSYCKEIKDESGSWEHLEQYITRRTDAKFSHGVCPKCYDQYLKPELEKLTGSWKREG